jgi:hypothetical protein
VFVIPNYTRENILLHVKNMHEKITQKQIHIYFHVKTNAK